MKLRTLSMLAPVAFYSSWGAAADIEQRQVDFKIEAQSLASALIEFSEQAQLQVMSQGVDLEARRTPGVTGRLTVGRALSQLLSESSLSYVETAPNTIAITSASSKTTSAAASNGLIKIAQATYSDTPPRSEAKSSVVHELEIVTVYGRGAAQTTVREVPQSTTVFDSVVLDSVPSPRIDDVIRYMPSTNNLLGDFALGNNFNVRGSSASYTWNGMIPSPVKPGRISSVNVERIEVLKGPSSITYGSMAPGAVINVVTKQPTDEFFAEIDLQGGSWDTYSGSLDIGGPLGEAVSARINASYLDRKTQVDHWKQEATFVAPVIKFDLSDRTTLTLEGTFDRLEHPYGIYDGRIPAPGTLLPNPNGPIPMATNGGYFEGVTHQVEEYRDASVRFRHEFSDSLTLNAQVTYADVAREGVDGFGAALAANNRTMTRTITPRDQGTEAYTATVNVAAKFDTGAITHRVVAGADYLDFESYGHLGSYRPSVGAVPALDVYNPNYTITQPLILTRTTSSLFKSNTAAVYLQERATIGDLSLIAGARYTDSQGETTSRAFATGIVTQLPNTDAKEWSTQLGVLYDFTDAWTVYANHSTSFLPRGAIQLRNGDFYGKPETAKQIEVGARYVLPNDMVASLALYRIVLPDVLTRDPVDINYFVPAGELQSEGIELALSGRILPQWSTMLSYGYNPTEVTKSNQPGQKGLEFQNAPKQTASLLTRYDVSGGALDGFGISAGVSYVGDRFAEATNVRELPAFTRVDLGLYYRLNDGLQFSLHANNITDEDIWSGFQIPIIMRNAGRNYMFGVKVTPTGF
ncbi:TonB-dependent siderophore receptor [Steroidobacter sp.]|uniref:TonB-dependent siderophore receptor n=1 Tax=Steroidobacter sp. TaxID=1978227 RepID=UPI001A64373D|nr:TonB-dependent siderophore receptor [Steroidobacter sp.]MBL8265904.1 TonB-dependent siderophore receptor [Steroidobacter sp.]